MQDFGTANNLLELSRLIAQLIADGILLEDDTFTGWDDGSIIIHRGRRSIGYIESQ